MSRIPRILCITGSLVAVALAALPARGLSPRAPFTSVQDDAAGVGTAAAYAAAFFAKDAERLTELHDATMAQAMPPIRAAALRDQLVAQNGALDGIDPAWREDVIGMLRRFRVPLRFERVTLDMRVVLDRDDRVAGLFFVPHVERPVDDAPVSEEDVVVGGASTGLSGTLSLPDGDGPFDAVVLVHGSGPSNRDGTVGPNRTLRDLAWGLAERGIAVLRYDKRSFARPADLVALGDRVTVQEEVIVDARAALALLRERDDIARTFLAGHSLGGSLAPRIATSAPRPDGLIVLAGATRPLPEMVVEQSTWIAGVDGEVSDAERAGLDDLQRQAELIRSALDAADPADEDATGPGFLGAPFAYYRDLEAHDPPAIAAELALPILVLQGRRDYQVTLEDYAGWEAALSDRPFACLALLDGLDHLLRHGEGKSSPADYERPAPVDPSVLDTIAAWITEARCPE